jgi:FAD-dependent halogenase
VKLPRMSWDVVVVGGGPAGSSAAGFLAMEGLKVLLVEKSSFPRFHIGESLAAASWPIWRKLGVADELDTSGQIIKQGAEFNLFGRKQFFYGLGLESPEYFPDNNGKFYAFQVVRADFDKMMLDNTRRLGVEVLQPATVEQIIFDGTRATGVVIAFPDGERARVSTCVVVDATGRDSFLARRLDLRHPDPKLNKISYFAHFQGAWRPRPNELPVWVQAFEGGWVWYIPLKDDLTSVGVLMDTEYARTKAGRDPQQFFRDSLARAPMVSDWIADAQQVSDLKIISALSYFTDRCVGDGWLLAGDAAIFVDPIFSSGVHIALRSGQYAAETIIGAFERGDFSGQSLGSYDRMFDAPKSTIFPLIYRWYNLLRSPDSAIDFLSLSERFPALRRRVNATIAGAYELVAQEGVLPSPSVALASRNR